ncbi:hypothetical protein Ancab_026083 [Ancistrocladus abbreviatus]
MTLMLLRNSPSNRELNKVKRLGKFSERIRLELFVKGKNDAKNGLKDKLHDHNHNQVMKQVFLSDSDEEEKMEKKTKPKRERPKKSGVNPIILKDIALAHCVESSVEFLKKRKLQVPSYRLSHTSKEIRPKLLRQVGIASL